jgi:hypothetical protein
LLCEETTALLSEIIGRLKSGAIFKKTPKIAARKKSHKA